jgi:hypothetical protein
MTAACEEYRGIEYVRIAAMPEKQKELFWISFDKNKIIKILKNETLLNDCVLFSDYSQWLGQHFKEEFNFVAMPLTNPVLQVA